MKVKFLLHERTMICHLYAHISTRDPELFLYFFTACQSLYLPISFLATTTYLTNCFPKNKAQLYILCIAIFSLYAIYITSMSICDYTGRYSCRLDVVCVWSHRIQFTVQNICGCFKYFRIV